LNTPADRLPTQAAQDYLEDLRERQGPVYRLALLLSPAWRIEPLLLRNARRRFFPDAPAVLEAQLWHSELVGSRSSLALVLRRDLADLMVRRLAKSPAYRNVWDFIQYHSRHWRARDRLAQDLRVAALVGSGEALTRLLNQALALLHQEDDPERRRDLARWAKLALHDWPAGEVVPDALGWLAQFAGAGVGDPLGELARPMAAAEDLPPWLAQRVPPLPPPLDRQQSSIGLLLGEGILACVDPGVPGAEPLALPGPPPYPVLLRWQAEGEVRLQWEPLWPGRRVVLGDADCREVLLRPLRGGLYRLAAEAEQPPPDRQSEELASLLAETDELSTPPERRLEIGDALARLGDPRKGVGLRPDGLPDIDWVEIPAGPFLYGDEGETRELPSFFIARYPVTSAQYQAFIDDGGYRDKRWWDGLAKWIEVPEPPGWGQPNRPRETVSWYEAMAFCRWLSDRLGYEVRLPTEYEWEKAARGEDGREYPWGDGYRSGFVNVSGEAEKAGPTYLGETTAVGLYPHAASPYGVEDLAGNVWEWCLNEDENPDRTEPGGHAPRALRGGSWGDPGNARASDRRRDFPVNTDYGIGFRVMCSSPMPR